MNGQRASFWCWSFSYRGKWWTYPLLECWNRRTCLYFDIGIDVWPNCCCHESKIHVTHQRIEPISEFLPLIDARFDLSFCLLRSSGYLIWMICKKIKWWSNTSTCCYRYEFSFSSLSLVVIVLVDIIVVVFCASSFFISPSHTTSLSLSLSLSSSILCRYEDSKRK